MPCDPLPIPGEGFSRKGWECPKCGKINSPDVKGCCQRFESTQDNRTLLNEVPVYKPTDEMLKEYKTDPELLKRLNDAIEKAKK